MLLTYENGLTCRVVCVVVVDSKKLLRLQRFAVNGDHRQPTSSLLHQAGSFAIISLSPEGQRCWYEREGRQGCAASPRAIEWHQGEASTRLEHELSSWVIQSGESSSSDSEDGLQHHHPQNRHNDTPTKSVANGKASPRLQPQDGSTNSSRSSSPNFPSPSLPGMRRSRSPIVKALSGYPPSSTRRTFSPSGTQRNKTHAHPLSSRYLLPATFCVSLPLPWGRKTRKVSGDLRKAGENIVLLASLLFGIEKLWDNTDDSDNWIAFELGGIIFLSILYLIWTHLSYFSLPKAIFAKRSSSQTRHRYRSSSPQVNKRSTTLFNAFPVQKDDFGYVWMTVPKNYRDSTDDGVLTALLLCPLISTACLYASIRSSTMSPSDNALSSSWLIEAPIILPRPNAWSALQSLNRSRHALVQLSSLTSSLLLVHLFMSRIYEGYHRARKAVPESERASVPRREWLRSRLYILYTFSVALAALFAKFVFVISEVGIWRDLSYIDVFAVASFYQLTLYTSIRLAHHSFTLGELGILAFGASIMFMETLHVTIARIWPITTLYIKTFRLPTPLLIFQLALISGSILVGTLLAPLLYLSRHIAQRPLRKLRFPEEKQRHRRLLALAFYLGAALIIGGLIGTWTRWCLNGRDPWLWTIFWILEGKEKWTRPLLLVYWVALACLSVAGWGRQLSRSRKYRQKASFPPVTGLAAETSLPSLQTATGPSSPAFISNYTPSHMDPSSTIAHNSQVSSSTQNALGIQLSLPTLPNGANVSVSTVANDLLDAADKRLPTLSLNARRKFFHALAVVMFVPGIAVDPAFTHLSFSVAFAAFTFAEYLRYFALYPFGAALHVFLTEFIDDKDGGTAILSHFYLLTGCASSIWLEGPSKLLGFTGVLALGIGDAMASIVGRRVGRTRWSASSFKTIEGSIAFTVSIVACAWLLRLCGLVEPFDTIRYTTAISIAAVLEALSVQNDNLTLPWYMWSMQVFMGI
ncbi:hypothetical protein EW145_g1022 [Phellinidium pouzarii]|uniref:dolichol kinase n=1 Tax=Phellinidium pouzarii TaxID=167371 RepID=A0A4V3XDS6_9AGAM|nr:hypothetical protein EW145_g1022 [Phellinidium pouzarii]